MATRDGCGRPEGARTGWGTSARSPDGVRQCHAATTGQSGLLHSRTSPSTRRCSGSWRGRGRSSRDPT
eukprot:2610016-Alexandrium_andersonii.AAC.1